MSGFALAVGVHVLLVPALLSFGYQAAAKQEERFVSVNLTPPTAPPQAAQPETPKQQKLKTAIKPPTPIPAQVLQPPILAAADATPIIQPVVNVAPAPPAPPAPTTSSSVISSDSLGARMVAGSPPRYPVESRRKQEQGTVELLLILGIDGAVESISVTRSSGFARLDDAALRAVRRWRWAPVSRNGAPVKVKGVVEIPFVLRSA